MTKLRVCYIINHYPKVSHSFIRREILAVERAGLSVERVSVRGWDQTIVDETDKAEQARTHYVLKAGVPSLLWRTAMEAIRSPRRFASALALALRMSRRSDRTALHHLAYLIEAADIASIVRERRVDHMHAHFGTNSTDVALLTSVLTGVPYSFTVHGADEADRPIQLNLPAKVSRARFVIAVSNYGRGQLFRWCPLEDWHKVQVVHCGVDEVFLGEPEMPPSFPNKLVCVGRLCNEKAQLLLVEAAAILAREGRDFQLVLAGDGEKRAEVEAMIVRARLEDKVSITGWIDGPRVRDEIKASRAVVLPSLMEGIPVALMESLALQRPVVTTYVGGIPELVKDGQQGWLVPAGSVEDLAQALRDCLDASHETIARLGAAGRAMVLEQHTAAHEAEKLAALFVYGAPPDGVAGAV